MVNFGLLTAEIRWRVWGTPSNFNGFRVLAALLHGTLVVGVSQTLRAAITLAHSSSSFFCFPRLISCSGRRLDVYHTSTRGVALVRIQNAGLKCAARGSLEMQDPKNRQKFAIWAPSHIFVGLYLRN